MKNVKFKIIKFNIEGMHCTSCAMNIDFDLEDLDGVKASKTSYAKQETEVEFDEGKLDEKVIVETIKKTGYQAKTA
jgi:copper chaperone CopZ